MGYRRFDKVRTVREPVQRGRKKGGVFLTG